MPIMYFGSKISENMVRTPEGYLICKNVPIGRIGKMDYLGEELGIQEKYGEKIKVYRKPEELFSKATIASFEGKSVTNDHPTQNLDLNTVLLLERGHVENVRQDGDFLVADLYIKDAGLISEIENGKREVSCGYDCLWVPNDDGTYEQREIVGNHVAVVQNGRAGSRVAIRDSIPNNKPDERSKKMKTPITQKVLAAIGFKQFAQDAEPEEIAKAMDALGGEIGGGNPEGDGDGTSKVLEAIAQLGEMCKSLGDRISALENSDKEVHKELGADEELSNLEKEVSDSEEEKPAEEEAKDEKAETVEPEKEEKAEDAAPAMDSAALSQFVKDMKPIIMAIPDEKARNEAAKAFSKSVRDAKAGAVKNGYGVIVNVVNTNKAKAHDSQKQQSRTVDNASKAAEAWNKMNAQNKEVK